MVMMSQGAHGSVKHIGGMFSGRKAKIDTTWSVPKCFPGCPVSCITVVTVIQWYFLSFDGRNNVHKDTSPWKQEFLERQFFAPMAATMIYYEVLKRMTPGVELETQLFIKC